ncbi:MAG TPA: LysR family transcriptional regulator [Solirubrobacteraceae bacterium]
MVSLSRLRALSELWRRGTIAAAAEAMHLTASAVSQQLAALEREVGQPLLERNGRGVRLTPLGRVLVRHADAIFADVESLHSEVAEHVGGRRADLRIGAFASAIAGVVSPAANELRRTHPSVRLQIVESEAPNAFDHLTGHELDIIISMEAPGAPAQDDPRIARADLVVDELQAVLPANHELASLTSVPIARLREDPWVAPPAGKLCGTVILAACQSAGFTPRMAHHTGDWTAVASLVAVGMGVALVPKLAGIEIDDRLAIRPLAPPAPARHLFVAWRRGAEHASATQAVIDALIDSANPHRSPRVHRQLPSGLRPLQPVSHDPRRGREDSLAKH